MFFVNCVSIFCITNVPLLNIVVIRLFSFYFLQKCYHKVCKFCTKLYSNLAENSLIGVICTGSEFQKPLSKKRTHANILKSALGNFYITLNSNVVIQTTTVDNDSK